MENKINSENLHSTEKILKNRLNSTFSKAEKIYNGIHIYLGNSLADGGALNYIIRRF